MKKPDNINPVFVPYDLSIENIETLGNYQPSELFGEIKCFNIPPYSLTVDKDKVKEMNLDPPDNKFYYIDFNNIDCINNNDNKKIIKTMKRFIFTFLLALVSSLSFAQQRPPMPRMPHFDFKKYEVLDSLPIERIMVSFDKEVDDTTLISQGGGYYMAPAPHRDKMIIRKTSDGTKAIVLYNSYAFGRHFEFNVKDNDRRIVLWYEDKHIFCGYAYDKKYKVAKYFESRKEFKHFMRHHFMERKPNIN